jgi:hypothetical protein
VLSDQGQAVDEKRELRGDVDDVIQGLALSKGGLRLIAEAIARAAGRVDVYPTKRMPDGGAVTAIESDGVEVDVHFDPSQRETNIEIRALALNKGKVPAKKAALGRDDRTPTQIYDELQADFMETLGLLEKTTVALDGLTDGGRKLISTRKLKHSTVFPALDRLSRMRDWVLQNLGADESPRDALVPSDESGNGDGMDGSSGEAQ